MPVIYNEDSAIADNLPHADILLEKELRRFKVYTEIADTFVDLTTDFKEMLAFTSRKLSELTNDLSVICLISDDGKNIDTTASYHPDDKIRNEFSNLLNAYPLSVSNGIIRQVIKTDLPLIVYGNKAKFTSPGLFSFEYKKFLKKMSFSGILSLPIHLNNKIIGTISLLRISSGFPFTTDEQSFLQSIVNLLASVKKNSRLYKEKNSLVREIHHRLKNNLQVISSLLSIQSDFIKDEESHKLFVNSLNRIRTMSMTHENINQESNLSAVDFDKYLKDLVAYLCRTYNINTNLYKINIKISPVSLPIDISITCGLIINELISNSFKHAFPDGKPGKIKIGFSNSEKLNKLFISDNGIGLPDTMDIEKNDSFGLLLIRTLADQLNGNLELIRKNGTKFIIRFPNNSN